MEAFMYMAGDRNRANYTYFAARSTSGAITIGSCLAVRWHIRVTVLFVSQLVCTSAVSTY